MALEIHRSAMENSDGQLRYTRKTRGAVFAPFLVVRELNYSITKVAEDSQTVSFTKK